MDDQRTMAQLLEAPTEGYEDAIVVPEINANFELKHGLINRVQNKSVFFEHDKEESASPHPIFRNKITSTISITTRSGVAYKGPTIPITSSSPKVMERDTEVTKDMMHPTNNGSTKDVPPPVVPIVNQESISEPANALVSASRPNQKASIPFPSRRNDERRHEKANDQIEKFYEIFRDLSFEISFTDALMLMPKFASTLKTLIRNKEKLGEMARTPLNENCSAVILNKLPKKLGDPGRFLIPCEFSGINTCNTLADLDPRVPLILERSFLKTSRALIDVYEGEITLRVGKEAITFNLDQTSRSQCNPTLTNYDPIISTSSPTLTPFGDSDFLLFEEADSFLALEDDPTSPEVDPTYYDLALELELKDLPPHLEYAFLEGDDKLPVIIAKDLKNEEKAALIEVLKSHKRAIAWKLSDIKGINPEFCTYKILMEEDYEPTVQHQRRDYIPTINVPQGLRVCIDYRKLNEATRKDHFPLPFMDQMLERLAGNQFYCFLDGFSGYFQIPIDPKDQEKTTFTCPYGTFAYRRMPFGLCNAPGTFQRCMMAIFHDMIEKMMEVFMDDFSVFGDSFSTCLTHLDKMLKRCEDTNLVLNWEKSHFMVKEGIVLGTTKISKGRIESIDAKLTLSPSSLTRLLKLTEAPILIAPDWDLPFELMCDASDFAIGAVLGQRKNKHFQPIHYASKTMTEAQAHYNTTEKNNCGKDVTKLMRWILLLQRIDVIIRDKKGAENLAADHLSDLRTLIKKYSDQGNALKLFPLELLDRCSLF
ncbi:reverse transcriptase domain-containing protein [Tanacetum coccineum]